MFHYLHGYMPDYWAGLVRRGFIDDASGLKLTQHGLTAADNTFNSVAREGCPVHSIVREANRPFYVDRLLGGTFYYDYRFDPGLINLYSELLGDRFYGFQIHEWASNFRLDWDALAVIPPEDWSKAAIEHRIRQLFTSSYGNLSCCSAEEFAQLRRPGSLQEFVGLAEALFQKRQRSVSGLLLPADSFYLAPKIELAFGSKRLMPEVGAQIPDMRIQMAYTRGMARSRDVPWGVYYEPWGGDPFGVCYYKQDNVNEWNIVDDGDFPFARMGGNGGSSRSLQARLHLYAYLCGAQFISEEWGLCNTFYDWKDYEVTPYGRVKLDFLNFVRKYPDVGSPHTPAAVVLPAGMPMLDLDSLIKDTYLGLPVTGVDLEKLRGLRRGLGLLFGGTEGALGNEAHVIKNGGCPDAFDIIHADDEAAAARYDLLVDMTGDSAFSQTHRNVCCAEDAEGLLRTRLPCWVDGGAHWMLNRTKHGWLLAVFNNNGVERTVERGEKLLTQADTAVTVTLKPGMSIRHIEGGNAIVQSGNILNAHLSAGCWLLAELA